MFLLEGQQSNDMDSCGSILPSLALKHTISLFSPIEGPTCGLLPVCGPVGKVWTEGLKWNLNGQSLRMGELISSSNRVQSSDHDDKIEISQNMCAVEPKDGAEGSKVGRISMAFNVSIVCSDDIVWSCELNLDGMLDCKRDSGRSTFS